MGLLIMGFIAALVGWLTFEWLGAVGGVIGGVVVFAGWYCFNLRSGTTGLFKANLNSYFAYRKREQR